MNSILRGFLLILPMFFVMAAGNILFNRHFLRQNDIDTLSKILFWIIAPAVLFRNLFHITDGIGINPSFAAGIFICAVSLPVLAAVTEKYIAGQRDIRRVALAAAASMRPNTIFMGLPTVQIIFGDQAIGLLSLYVAIALPLYNLLSPVTSEIILASGTSRGVLCFIRTAFHKLIRNPMVVAPVCGMILLAAGVKSLPVSLDKSLNMLASAATGISLLALGATINFSDMGKAFKNCWREVITRLLLHPAMLFLWFAYFPVNRDLMNVSVILTAMPTAATLFVLSKGIGLDSVLAGEITVITTLASALTIPLWIVVLGII